MRFPFPPPLGVVLVNALVGSMAGLVAGYFAGWAGEVVMRISEILLKVPTLILAMAVVVDLGPSALHAAIAVSVVWWPGYARLTRAETLVVKKTSTSRLRRRSGRARCA